MELRSAILQRPNLVLEFREDNQAMIKVMASGHSPTMRHLSRTHRVDLKWLSECSMQPWVDLKYCDTKRQAADLFTKAFHEPDKWEHARELNHHVYSSDHWGCDKRELLLVDVEGEPEAEDGYAEEAAPAPAGGFRDTSAVDGFAPPNLWSDPYEQYDKDGLLF